jgi:hypothetical protein
MLLSPRLVQAGSAAVHPVRRARAQQWRHAEVPVRELHGIPGQFVYLFFFFFGNRLYPDWLSTGRSLDTALLSKTRMMSKKS